MKLTMYCNGGDEPQCTCEGGNTSDNHASHMDDMDPDLAYATISPNVLVLETTDHEEDLGVNVNGVHVQPPAADTPRTSSAAMQAPPPYIGEQQLQQEEEEELRNEMVVAMFPSPPLTDHTGGGLMALDDGEQEGEYVLAGGEVDAEQVGTEQPRFSSDDQEARFGLKTGRVRRSVRIRLDLKITTTTRTG